MSKQVEASARGQQPTGATATDSGRKRTTLLLSVTGLAVLILAGIVVKRHAFPNYWTAEDLGPISVNTAAPPGSAPEGMVWVPGGVFWMGSDNDEFADARPVHKVYVDGFWMDKTEVTNEQFAKFVDATGYVTVVERWPDADKFKGFDAKNFGFQPEYVAPLGGAANVGFPGTLSWPGVSSTRPLLKPFSLVFTQPV